jgi:hypothetical protein
MKPMLIKPEVYQLVLSRDDVQFLVDVLGYVGGEPDTTRRGISVRLRLALMEAPDIDDGVPDDMTGDGVMCAGQNR